MNKPHIIYNVTVKITEEAFKDWYQWMKEVHIPDVMATGKFIEWKMKKILGDDDPTAITLAIQYRAESMDDFMDYSQHHAQRLQKEHQAKYEGKYVAFRTLMEVLDES